MQLERMKKAIVGTWGLAWAIMAMTIHVDSMRNWAMLVGLGVVPPLMLLRMWRQPAPTMSESIHAVLK